MSAGSVVIVGAGITGVCTAEWMRRDGWAVTLVDPVLPGDVAQTSFGNAGLLARTSVMPVATPSLVRKAPFMVLDPDSPLFLRWSYLPRLLPWLVPFLRNASAERIRGISVGLSAMTADTNEQHQALARGTGAERFFCSGELVTLFPQREAFEGDALGAEIRARYKLFPELLDRAQIVERDPKIGPHYNFATAFKDFCWLSSPGGYVAALFDHFRRHGGAFRQARVASVRPGAMPAVILGDGETLLANKVVLSAGAWSGKIASDLGVKMKVEAERGYHIAIHAPAFMPPSPYFVSDAKMIVTPMDGFLRAAGITEFGGIDAPPARQPTTVIEAGLRRMYPGLEFEVHERWMGRRPTTPDSLPVIGESSQAPNILHAYGGQHVGLTIGPKVGRLIADLAGRRGSNLDLSPYRPDRF